MFELIFDNRSGNKLEIVIPTFNEEKRIKNILQYYGNDFDVVLLDDNSNDKTADLAKEFGATVFRRLDPAIGESHYVNYANSVTKSGYSFYFFADEFVDKQELFLAFKDLQNENSVIIGRRIDWAYGKCAAVPTCALPRGFRKGTAKHFPSNLHNSLKYFAESGEEIREIGVDIYHLHMLGVIRIFGTPGKYVCVEVDWIRRSKYPVLNFIRRFIFGEITGLARKLWRFRNCGFPILLWFFVESFIAPLLAILAWIEQTFLINIEEQYEKYSEIYFNEIKKNNVNKNKFM